MKIKSDKTYQNNIWINCKLHIAVTIEHTMIRSRANQNEMSQNSQIFKEIISGAI